MSPPLSGRGSVSHSMVGRYTQARQRRLMGQNSKTLVTAGTIKRPLPCPVEGIEKKTKDVSHNVKRKTEQEEKEKDKNENREKRKEN